MCLHSSMLMINTRTAVQGQVSSAASHVRNQSVHVPRIRARPTTSEFTPGNRRIHYLNLVHSCTAGNKPPVLTTWLFYVFSMSYDIITLGISTMYLLGFASNAGK